MSRQRIRTDHFLGVATVFNSDILPVQAVHERRSGPPSNTALDMDAHRPVAASCWRDMSGRHVFGSNSVSCFVQRPR